MTTYHLAVVDTAAIQPYIFGSNRLRENVGASFLVSQATGRWALEAVVEAAPDCNVRDAIKGELDGRTIEHDRLDAEVVYSGGGNLVAIFAAPPGPDPLTFVAAFTRALSEQVLAEAPGLRVVVAHTSFAWDSEPLGDVLDRVFRDLARIKQERALSAPLPGLSVTEPGRSTAGPAIAWARPAAAARPEPVSAEALAKIEAARPGAGGSSPADDRLLELVPITQPDAAYPRDFDDLGRTAGEHSFLAVVHADGNGMGQRVRDAVRTAGPGTRPALTALRAFSETVEAAARSALVGALAAVRIDQGTVRHPAAHLAEMDFRLAIDHDRHMVLLPFRPIVFGGDDVTFVCDGRLGLALATDYLLRWEAETARLLAPAPGLTACAGVALVKSHYPFARAYALAGALSRSAKDYRLSLKRSAGSAIDWHVATTGLTTGLAAVRAREYRVPVEQDQVGSLILRPVTLDDNRDPDHEHRSWRVVRRGIDAFQSRRWIERRNKVKLLREKLREGPAPVATFVRLAELDRLPDLNLPDATPDRDGHRRTGWYGSGLERRSAYFDAIELADSFIPTGER